MMKSSSLSQTHPTIAAQWHPTLNGELTPDMVTYGSHYRAWWWCQVADDHIWEATVKDRVHYGCPCCNGRKIVLSNCLATTHPNVVENWHPTLNIDKTPYNVTSGSGQKVWWCCKVADDHVWEASIANRIKYYNTTHSHGCPCCAGKKVVLSSCLATTHPGVAAMWHPVKNGSTPYDAMAGSTARVWWRCDKQPDHEWHTAIRSAVKGKGCPCCLGRKVVKSNCLAVTRPDIAKQWHTTLNGEITPYEVTAGSGYKFWWQCDAFVDHTWEARVVDRVSGEYGCPRCAASKGEVAIENCLMRLGLTYKREHKFDTCKVKRKLIFDFVVECNGLRAIEYQGQQHHYPCNFGSTKISKEQLFACNQTRDEVKRRWCKENNVPLLEIPYWDFDRVDSLIEEFVNITL